MLVVLVFYNKRTLEYSNYTLILPKSLYAVVPADLFRYLSGGSINNSISLREVRIERQRGKRNVQIMRLIFAYIIVIDGNYIC